jgi:beta propeller repeat protein
MRERAVRDESATLATRRHARRWVLRGAGLGLAALLLLTPGGLPGPGQPAGALAEARPYNSALLVSNDAGTALDSTVTDGATLAWLDARGAIFTRTLADGRETRVLDGPAKRTQLVMGGGILAWIERDTGGVALRGLRLSGGDPFTIASGAGERNSPAIGDGTIVWREARGGGWVIAGRDLNGNRDLTITTTPAARGAVALAGNVIVWEEFRDGHWTIIRYDIKEGREAPLTGGADEDTAPRIGTDAVTFARRKAGQTDGAIILRDLNSGQERTLTSGHLVLRPTIAGDLIVWEDWRDGVPNIYAFDRASGKEFAVDRTEEARAPAIGGTIVVWLGKGQLGAHLTAVRLVKALPSDPQDPPTLTDPDVRYFSETKHNIVGAFRQYWTLNGGLATFGYPLTEAFEETGSDGTKRQVQYFERAKLEANPQDTKQIALARLGADITAGRTFPGVGAFDATETRVYFPQTGHALSNGFLAYWREHGGVNTFGYPLSEELQENGRTVQYFERARFEVVPATADTPASVGLGQIGREALVQRGWLAAEPQAGH